MYSLLPYKSIFKYNYIAAKLNKYETNEPYNYVFFSMLYHIIFNVWTVTIILSKFFEFDKIYNLFATFLFGIFIFYIYYRNSMYKRLAEKYDKELHLHKKWTVFAYTIFRYFLDAFIMFIAALYKNGDWIFG